MGTACYVKGASEILETLKEELGIGVGETTEDMLFSMHEARCNRRLRARSGRNDKR
jgi:NADH:ubiquinone oxidoreductase subunit E